MAQVVWPPVVVIENAGLGEDAAGKPTGLGNAEIKDAVEKMVPGLIIRRVMSLYDRRGHTGRAFVVFHATDTGFMEAKALHEMFKNVKRGREELVSASAEEKRAQDGKLVLYGYLAEQRDMDKLDKHKKCVTRWSMESYQKKVLEPQQKRLEDEEKLKEEAATLDQSMEMKTKKLEHERAEYTKLCIEQAKVEAEVEEGRKKLEESKRRHEELLRERAARLNAERTARLNAHAQREAALRLEIQQKMEADLQEISRIASEQKELMGNISRQKEENKKCEEALRRGISLESRLARMKQHNAERLAELKQKHQQEKIQLKEKHAAAKQRLLEEALAKKMKLDEKTVKAKQDVAENECGICMEEFLDNRQRALYATCGHGGRVCLKCALDHWTRSKACPLCRTEQEVPPSLFMEKYFF